MHLTPDSQDLMPEAVRERFRWAVRQGSPAWLWPDIAPSAWRDALSRIESATRQILDRDDATGTLSGDALSLGLAAYTSGMGPLLGCWLERGRLDAPAEIAAILGLHLSQNRRRTARLRPQETRVIDALAASAIPVAMLKGAHTGPVYFPEAGARPRSDLDLLVPAEKRNAAEAAMTKLGLIRVSRRKREESWRPAGGATLPRSLTLVHADDPWTVDLHLSLDLSPGPGAARARLDEAGPLSARSRWPEDRRALVLDQPLLLLHLAAHAGSGFHNLTLLRLVELILVIRRDRAEGRLSWPDFLDLGLSTGALGLCFPPLALAEKLMPGTVPAKTIMAAAAAAPTAVRRILAALEPFNAQRVDRASVAEHFMWASGWRGLASRIAGDAIPSFSPAETWSIYERRAWRLVRRTVSR